MSGRSHSKTKHFHEFILQKLESQMRDVAYGTKQYNVVTAPEVCFACIQYTCTLSESNSSNNDLNRFRGTLIHYFV